MAHHETHLVLISVVDYRSTSSEDEVDCNTAVPLLPCIEVDFRSPFVTVVFLMYFLVNLMRDLCR